MKLQIEWEESVDIYHLLDWLHLVFMADWQVYGIELIDLEFPIVISHSQRIEYSSAYVFMNTIIGMLYTVDKSVEILLSPEYWLILHIPSPNHVDITM